MRILLLLSFLIIAAIAHGRQISEGEAASIASEFFNSATLRQASEKAGVRFAKAPNAVNAAPFYVFNADDNNGFVIVAGDDRAPRILGYSDKGNFDFYNLPPQLDALLEQYDEQIKHIPANAVTHDSWKVSMRDSEENGVLLETVNWGQGAPYNSLCPLIDGVHAPVGCVASAMAIVMKYHNWPEKYDWDTMPTEANTIQNSSEIARLMKDAGESVFMEYSILESSAQMNWVGHKLQQDFKYSPDCQFITAQNFNQNEWFSMIRENLESNLPVIYTGSGRDGGHAFVIDGLKDDLYHINWGWDGALNGYYALNSLCSSDFDFNNNQGMVVHIEPDRSEKEYSRAFMDNGYFFEDCGNFEKMNISVEKIDKCIPFDFTVQNISLPAGFNGEVGLALVSKNNDIKHVISSLHYALDSESHCYGVGLSLSQISILCDLDPTDRLHIVTKEIYENEWKLVLGTIEYGASIPVINNKPRYGNIKFIIDKNLTMNCTYGYHPSVTSSDFEEGEHIIRVLKGHHVSYAIKNLNEAEGQIHLKRMCSCSTNTSPFNGNRILSGKTIHDDFTVIDDYVIEINLSQSEGPVVPTIVIDKIKYKVSQGSAEVVGFIDDPTDVVIPSILKVDDSNIPVTKIGDNAFENCITLKSIYIPSSIESLGEHCFLGCLNLENVHLNEIIQTLPKGAFVHCRSLKTLEPTNNLTYIDRSVFSYSGLEYFYVPSYMQLNQYDCPLSLMPDLQKIEIDDDHPDWSIYDECLYHKGLNKLCVVPAKGSRTALHFKDGIESIDAFAIYNVESLKEIIIPDNVKRMGFCSISDCVNLEYLVLPRDCSFNESCIQNCPSLRYVYIPYHSPYPNRIIASSQNIKAIYLAIEPKDNSPINIKGIFADIHKDSRIPEFFINSVDSQIENYGNASIYLPGKASGMIEDCQEMWTYRLHRDRGAITIVPLIRELAIDKVTINGKAIAPDENYIYRYGELLYRNGGDLDVVVDYTLHGRQTMTTHYTPEFNALLPDEEMESDIMPISIDENDSDFDGKIDVYNFQGILLISDCSSKELKTLKPGVYLIVGNGKVRKISLN